MGAREQGALVDRLMARIGELEAKFYNTAELSDAQFTIPAIHGEAQGMTVLLQHVVDGVLSTAAMLLFLC